MLVATAKVLASILGNPDIATKGIMVILEVGDKLLSIGTIPVSGNEVDVAATALADEVLEPELPRRSVGRGRGTEGITLGFERLKVFSPELNATLRADVGLTFLIGLVHAQDKPGISTLDVLVEVINLLVTPEHRHEFDPRNLVHPGGLPRAPVVDEFDLSGALDEVGDIDIASIGNADLA